jgi:hypothetical protein
MKQDRLLNFALGFLDRRTGSHASRKIGHVGGVVPVSFFDNYRVSHSVAYLLSPACLRILFNVPGGKSSLGTSDTFMTRSFPPERATGATSAG